jgi:hypothetical protein
MHVSISWEGGERRLAPGRYVIGRHSACDIVFDEARVSPRHAELTVGGSSVILFDLRSASGVYVNEERVRQSRSLQSNDVIRIGSRELEISIRGDAREPVSWRKIHTSAPASRRRSSIPPRAYATTARDQALAVIAGLADKAIASGRANEAENMLEPRLTSILDDAKHGSLPSQSTCDSATRAALRLARATGEGRWFDYVIELLDIRRAPLPDALAAELGETLPRVHSVDAHALRRYSITLQGLDRGLDKIRSLHNAERLNEILTRRRA